MCIRDSFWDDLEDTKKIKIISKFLENFKNIEELVDYFNNYYLNLSKNTLNSYLKSVINQ